MTSDQRRSFESEWGTIQPMLRSYLARRGLKSSDCEDITQETALRLIRSWDSIDRSRPLAALAMRTAQNLMIDRARRRSTSELPIADVPDRFSVADVENESLGRIQLREVGSAIQQLKPAYKAVLLDDLDPAVSGAEKASAATKMLRMRARRRLRELVQAASSFVGVLAHRIRSWVDQAALPVTSVAAALAVTALLPSGDFGSRSNGPLQEITGTAQAISVSREGRGPAVTHVDLLAEQGVVFGQLASGTEAKAKPRPVTVPLGRNGKAEASAELAVGAIRVEVGQQQSGLPACADGAPGLPDDVSCPEDG